MKATEAAVGSLEKQTATSADAITKRFFSMHQAAAAFLGAFTVGGGILAFKSFVGDIFEAQENFKTFSTSLSNAKQSVFQLAGEVLGFNVALKDTSTILDNIRQVSEKAKTGSAGWLGILGSALWGTTSLGKLESLLHTTAAVLDKANPPGEATGYNFGPNDARTYGPQLPKGRYAAEGSPYAPLATKIALPPNLADPIRDFGIAVDQSLIKARELGDYIGGREDGLPSMAEAFGEIWVEDVTGKVQASISVFEDMRQQLTAVNFVFDLLNQGISTFASILTNAFSGAGANFRQGMSEILKSVSQMAFVYALWNVALGIMASTGYGAAALQGTPHQFFMAAAKFAAVGAAAGLAARAGGHAGSEGAGGGSAAGASATGAASAPASGPSYSWSFNIEGNVLSQESFVRDLMLWSKRALADGAAGGAL